MADVTEINHKLYFSFFEADYDHLFIWETDGSPSGSRIIYDEYAAAYFIPSNLSSDGSSLIFTGKGTDNATSLLTLSTDTYEITEIRQLVSNPERPFFHRFSNIITRLSDNLYHIVVRWNSKSGETWFSDLTAANTVPRDIMSNNLIPPFSYNGNLYFAARSEREGQELWKANPAFSEQELFMNINKSEWGYETYSSFAALDDQILFRAVNAGTGSELWKYQQSTDKVSMVTDLQEGEKSSFPSGLIRFKDHIYFEAVTENRGSTLFRSDGTAEGTSQLSDAIETRDQGKSISMIVPAKEQVYFVARLINGHFGLCATDGTDTWVIKDLGLSENNTPYSVSEMVAVENKVFFTTQDAGDVLWISDGTEAGTFKVREIFGTRQLTAASGKVYFVASGSNLEGTELWQSDGTASGTTKITNSSGEAFSWADNLTLFKDQLVFTASTATHGRELWKTDGTAAETAMITDIRSGTAGAISTTDFAIMDGFLYFSANDGINGRELWKTDGTAAGTAMVGDFYPGEAGAQPKSLFSAGDFLYFSAYTPESGYELWTSQGTAASSSMVYDLIDGPQGSDPSNFMILAGELYFTAETGNAGRQLWRAGDKEVTAVAALSKSDGLKVYPNPTADYLYIDSEGQAIKSLQLFSLNGQRIPLSGQPGSSLHLAHLPAGLYLLAIETGQKRYVKKFIKK